MTYELMDALNQVALSEGLDVSTMQDYSGRGMRGETTNAIVVGSYSDFYMLIFMLGVYIGNGKIELEWQRIAEQIAELRFDTLGLGYVIY